MNKRNKSVNLFRVVEGALADIGNLSSVQKVIPIAWPVLEVEHHLRLCIQEELAFVERHILEAVARFGPASPEAIGEIMGLDGGVVEHLMAKLERFPGTILRDGRNLQAADSVLERLSEDCWTHEVVQPYGFWVNGPTGNLLPDKSIRTPDSNIVVEYDGGGLVMSRAGQKLNNMYWIAPSQGHGIPHLNHLLNDSNQAARTEFGIPDGAFALESSGGQIGSIRWEFAIGELIENVGLRVRLASQPNVVLVEVAVDRLSDFGEMLRRGKKTFFTLGKLDDKKINQREKVPASWADFSDCEIRGGDWAISLKNSDAIPLQGIENDGEQDEHSDALPKMPQDLLDALECLRYWHPYHFTVRQVVPGDSGTAALIVKIRALGLLRELADKDLDEFNFEQWWEEAQAEIIAGWPESVCPESVLWTEIRDVALRSRDSDLVEFVSEFL